MCDVTAARGQVFILSMNNFGPIADVMQYVYCAALDAYCAAIDAKEREIRCLSCR